jgi:hypothetical protein
MTYTAKIKTGIAPLTVTIKKPKFIGEADTKFKLKRNAILEADAFESLIIPAKEACCFLKEYAKRRNLNIGYDANNGNYTLFNPRHQTFRYIHLHNDGYDILSFVEAEYVTVKRS